MSVVCCGGSGLCDKRIVLRGVLLFVFVIHTHQQYGSLGMSGPFMSQTEKDYLKMARIYAYVFLF